MESNLAPEGGENNPSEQPGAVEPQVDLKYELDERFSRFESSLLEKIEAKQAAPKTPEMTAEQYQELLKSDPAKAIEIAVARQVQQKLQPEVRRLAVDQQRIAMDQKAEIDFPLLKSDKAFQKEVRAQLDEFVRNGEYAKESPMLVYRAAEFAALKYKAKSQQAQSRGGISGEAPNTEPKEARTRKPDNFEMMSSMFGLSKESKERLLAKQKAKGGN